MFQQTSNDTFAASNVGLRITRITRALGVTRATAFARLKSLALCALALGVLLSGAQAARAQETRLYAADYANARVAVFDTKHMDAMPTWVQTGAQPFGVLASPDGRRVYTANYASDSVTVIDTTVKPNPVPVYNTPAGDGPYQLALSPDAATLYVSDFDGAAVTALNVGGNTTPTIKWTLSLPYSPTAMAVTPDGRYLFVNQYQDWKTLVVDLSAAMPQVVRAVNVGPAPVAMTMSKDGKRLYVANEFDEHIQWGASLSIINSEDPEHASEIERLQLAQGASPRGQMALSANGRWLYIAEGGTANVTTVDLLNSKIEHETRTWPGPLGAALSPDNAVVYSSNEGNAISVVSTADYSNVDFLIPYGPNETPARFECIAFVTLPTCP